MPKYRNPKINVYFTSVSGDKIELESMEFGGDIISIEIDKTLDQPVGSFNLTLIGRTDFSYIFNLEKKDQSLYEIFRPSGLIDIYIDDKEKMLGLVDGVKKSVIIGDDGKPSRSWVVYGRDLGSLLIDHKVWYDDTINIDRKYQQSILAGLSSFGVLSNLNTAQLIEKIINVWLIGVINQEDTKINVKPFEYSDGKKAQDKLIVKQNSDSPFEVKIGLGSDQISTGITLNGKGAVSTKCYNDNFLMQFSMMQQQCDLFNYVKQLTNSPFNELFIDTGGTEHYLSSNETIKLEEKKVYLIFRPTPYDDKNVNKELKISGDKLDSLLDVNDLLKKSHKITDDEIISKDLDIGRNSIPSTYYAIPKGGLVLFSQAKQFCPPFYDDKILRRYGYNPMQFDLSAISFYQKDETNQAGITKICDMFQKKAYSWFYNNDKYMKGSFQIRGNSNIRIGQVLEYVKNDIGEIEDEYQEGYFYIRGVKDSWSFGKRYISTITVDRGISKKEFGL
jgi:hypothetical protein